MRIADRMVTNVTLNNVTKSLNLLNTYSTQASTGKKIQNPSDNPIIASRALRYRTTISETNQYLENVAQAKAWLQVTESTLNNINSIIQSMRELCVQGANDTYTTSDRQKIYTEFSSLLEQLESELNTTYMGRYIFSGFFTNTSPIVQDEDGNNILNTEIYGDTLEDSDAIANVDGQEINVAIGSSSVININSIITDIYDANDYANLHFMDEIFAAIGEDSTIEDAEDQDGIDIIDDADDVDETDDSDESELSEILREAFSSMISILDDYMAKVSVEQTKVGVKLNRLELTESKLNDDYINYTALQSDNEDIDLAEISIKYNAASAAYSAALKIGVSINQLTLADYI